MLHLHNIVNLFFEPGILIFIESPVASHSCTVENNLTKKFALC